MSLDINIAMSRSMLRATHSYVRKHFPEIRRPMRAAGVTCSGRDQWFVQIESPGRPMFNFDCRAHNAYDARLKAWDAFIRQHDSDFGSHEILSVRQNASAWRYRKAPKAGAEGGR